MKKDEIIEKFRELSKDGYCGDGQITKQLDDIKAYQVNELTIFYSLFFFTILIALLINIIRCVQEGIDADLYYISITNTGKILTESMTLILLIYYGISIHNMKVRYRTFHNNCTSFSSGLDFATRMNRT